MIKKYFSFTESKIPTAGDKGKYLIPGETRN